VQRRRKKGTTRNGKARRPNRRRFPPARASLFLPLSNQNQKPKPTTQQPNKRQKKDDADRVGNLFESARRHGAQEGRAEDLSAEGGGGGASGRRPPAAFQGASRTLAGGGGAGSGSAGAGPSSEAAAAAPALADAPAEPRTHVITFYAGGVFTVDGGPPRQVGAPENSAFVEAIGRGECPAELDPGPDGAPVTVNLLRRDAPYSGPEAGAAPAAAAQAAAFQGAGQTLGGGGGGGGGGAAAVAAAAAAAAAGASSSGGGGEWEGVDESAPTTSLQLRMADGSRLLARFNVSHTVSDVRRFVRASRPDLAQGAYAFASGGFPPALVADESRSLESLGLLNAVLVQRRA